MGRTLTTLIHICLLLLATFALGSPAFAEVKTCRYSIQVVGFRPGAPAAAVLPLPNGQFSVRGRVWTTTSRIDDAKEARKTAARGADRCLRTALNSSGTPPECTQKQSYRGPGYVESWSRVTGWNIVNLKNTAINFVCSTPGPVSTIRLTVVRESGSKSCNIRGQRGYTLWIGRDGYCTRPIPRTRHNQPLAIPGRPNLPPPAGTGRPLPPPFKLPPPGR